MVEVADRLAVHFLRSVHILLALWANRKRNQIIQSLVIPLMAKILNVLPDSPAERLLTEEYHLVNALMLDG